MNELIRELTAYARRKSGSQQLAKVPIDLLQRTIDALQPNQAQPEQPEKVDLPPGHYKIRSLTDFDQIPPEKLAACLTDFCAWVQFHKDADKLFDFLFGDLVKVTSKPELIWIDDDIRGISAIEISEGERSVGRLEIGTFEISVPGAPGTAMFQYGSMGEYL